MSQPAVLVHLSLQGETDRSGLELASQFARVIAEHFHFAEDPVPEVPDGESALRQVTVVIAHFYVLLMQRCGMPAFSRPRLRDVGDSEVCVLLPCARGDQLSAAALVQWLLNAANLFFAQKPLYGKADELSQLIKKLVKQAPPGLNTIRFLAAAHAGAIPFQRITGTTYQYGWGVRARLFDSSFTDVTPTIASNLARDKFATASLLRRAGLPVPEHQFAASEADAAAVAARLGYPVVVKPSDLDGGVGVFAGLVDEGEVIAAYRAARKSSRKILVEKHFQGNDYRLQVLNGKVFWAVHRVPGGVMGNGSSTVESLLHEINADPVRGERGSTALLKRIDLDDEARALLLQQGFTLQSIPEAGQFVRLRRAANVASGGRPVPVLGEAHPDNLALAERAARILRLDLAGIDLLIPNIQESWVKTGAAICEVNAQPQLSPHLPAVILERLVKSQGRIPIILIIGGHPDAGTALALADSLTSKGLVTGFASRRLSFVGGRTSTVSASNPLAACEALLLDPSVEVAVLFLDDAQWLRQGLPFDQCSAFLMLGDPSSFINVEGVSRSLEDVAGICVGPIYCESPLESWGMRHGQNAHSGNRADAIDEVTWLALRLLREDRSAITPQV